MTIDFGWHPQDIRIILSAGQDFILEIAPTDPTAIPDGATVVLKIYAPETETVAPAQWPAPLATWDATISNGVVSWNISSDLSDVIPKFAFVRLILTYPDDGSYVWAKGQVDRDD